MNREEFKQKRAKSAESVTWTIQKERAKRNLASGAIVTRLDGALSMLAPYGVDVFDYCVYNCPYCTARSSNRWSKGIGRSYFSMEKFGVPFTVYDLETELYGTNVSENVLLSPYCDPLQSEDLHEGRFRAVAEVFLDLNVPIVVLTKSAKIHEFLSFFVDRKELCKVGTTLLAVDDRYGFLTEYETGVPNATERIADLGEAKKFGLQTFVVLLPVLSSREAVACVNATLEYADDYFISGFSDDKKKQFPVDVCSQAESVKAIIDALRSNGKRFYIDRTLQLKIPNVPLSYDEITAENHWLSKNWVFNELSRY